MDKKSRQKISKDYDDLVKKHGFSMRALHNDGARYDKEHQEYKFQFVLDQLDEKDSLLWIELKFTHIFTAGVVYIPGSISVWFNIEGIGSNQASKQQ